MLYISDTGNSRIAKLNTKSGVKGKTAPKKEELAGTNYYDNAEVTDFVSADSALVAQPSGIAIKGNYVYVADASNGRISAFNMKGELVNHVDTGLAEGTVGGITFGPDNKLYLVDMVSHRVLRVDPKPAAK
jgi:DNA-binding beta-propeller fold protein YncE